MKRLPDWQSRLSEYLTSCARTCFKYGTLDCGLFVADAIQATTGVDVADPLRDKYRTRTEAFAAIKVLCGKASMEAVAAYLAARHGIQEVPVLCAQRGDAVVLGKGSRSALGIVAMHGTEILTPYKDGILRLPLSHALKAYRI
jgi:hypothetical protein